MGLMDMLFESDDNSFGSGVDLGDGNASGDDGNYSWFDSDWLDGGDYAPEFESQKDEPDWSWFTGDFSFDEFNVDEPDWSEFDEPNEDDKLMGKISGSIWDRLLDAGIGGLSEWLRQKNSSKPKSGGGGGGKTPPVTAITAANPVGTRTKN